MYLSSYIDSLSSQSTIQNLFTELDKAYAKRDELWTNLQQALDESGNISTLARRVLRCITYDLSFILVRNASEDLKAVPEKIERTIASCEKRSKDLDKDGGSSKAKEKMLRGLIKLG